jgi:uncharacterized paraquat-inducible protein A
MACLLIDIFIIVRVRKRTVTHSVNVFHGKNKVSHHRNLQRQMFILMTTSIFIFLITTLPIAIYKITAARQQDISTAILTIVSVWVGLGWLQSLNYAVCISLLHD